MRLWLGPEPFASKKMCSIRKINYNAHGKKNSLMKRNWAEIFPFDDQWRALVQASLWANEPINEFDR